MSDKTKKPNADLERRALLADGRIMGLTFALGRVLTYLRTSDPSAFECLADELRGLERDFRGTSDDSDTYRQAALNAFAADQVAAIIPADDCGRGEETMGDALYH